MNGATPGGWTRRGFLRAGGLLAAGGLAGCLGGLAGRGAGATGSPDDGAGLTLETLDVRGSPGEPVAIPAAGTVTLVDFFATWCGPCRQQMETLGTVRDDFGDELFVVSVTTESDRAAIRRFWREYDGRWPVALDARGDANLSYAVKGIPTLVLLGADGIERWRHRGLAGIDAVVEQVETAIADGGAATSG